MDLSNANPTPTQRNGTRSVPTLGVVARSRVAKGNVQLSRNTTIRATQPTDSRRLTLSQFRQQERISLSEGCSVDLHASKGAISFGDSSSSLELSRGCVCRRDVPRWRRGLNEGGRHVVLSL